MKVEFDVSLAQLELLKKFFKKTENVNEKLLGQQITIADKTFTSFKVDNNGVYYLMDECYCTSEFGNNNNYNESRIQKILNDSELNTVLSETFKDKLVPVKLDLLSLNGYDDYGIHKGNYLGIPTFDMFREGAKYIKNISKFWWLSTPLNINGDYVCYVNSSGYVGYTCCSFDRGVRPFFILKL